MGVSFVVPKFLRGFVPLLCLGHAASVRGCFIPPRAFVPLASMRLVVDQPSVLLAGMLYVCKPTHIVRGNSSLSLITPLFYSADQHTYRFSIAKIFARQNDRTKVKKNV